jgi:hypothetical protein
MIIKGDTCNVSTSISDNSREISPLKEDVEMKDE